MKSRIISLFVMVAFVLTLGLGSSFAQDTTKTKMKHKAKVEKTMKHEKKEKAEKKEMKSEKKASKKKAMKKDTTAAK